MRILQVNKFHYPRGGADKYYLELSDKLIKEGHELAVFSMRHPKNLPSPWEKYFVSRVSYNEGGLRDKLMAPLRMIYSFEARRKFAALLEDFKPDIIHVHNIYNQLSPSLLDAAARRNIPVIMHLHDYNLVSPNRTLYLGGRIYERCVGGHYFRCVIDKCHKDSYLKSLLAALTLYIHNRVLNIYRRRVKLFIAPSRFMKEKMHQAGFNNSIIVILPNFVADELLKEPLTATAEDYFLYFGRLSEEKGIDVLLKAAAIVEGVHIKIVGDGPQAVEYKQLAASLGLAERVEFQPAVYGRQLTDIIKKARTVVIPSVWYENMPLALLESLALGKTVIVTRRGGMPEIIREGENGYLVDAGNVEELAAALKTSLSEGGLISAERVRASVSGYSLSAHYEKLMSLYEEVLGK